MACPPNMVCPPNMAKNKLPPESDIEEGLQITNATFHEPMPISDQERIRETGSDGTIYFPLVTSVIKDQDKPHSLAMTESKFRFLWPYSVNHTHCCIYRVPCRLRNVKPDAYTPQMVLIGPLSKKPQIMELPINKSRRLEYEKMEQHKKKYLENFELMYGTQTVEEFRRIIIRDEQIIRACYAESTEWIKSEEFVEMMLVDSVFILVYLRQTGRRYIEKTGDFLFDEPCHKDTIFEDLLLLENQLPFFLLENLFEPFFVKYGENLTFRDFILGNYGAKKFIKSEVKFLHITDLFRSVRVEKLGLTKEERDGEQRMKKKRIKNLQSADELDSAGVDIVGYKAEKSTSFVIKFERGVLTMPCFILRGHTETLWRNVMALEQCHYTYAAYVCHYITFLDCLMDNDKDVELLIQKEVIKNLVGNSESVLKMVNRMCLGLADNGSYYYDVAERLDQHYKNCFHRSWAALRRVYFTDLWTGTATVAAIILLALTLISTVTSVLQLKPGRQ